MARKIFKITSAPTTKGEYLLEALYAGVFGGVGVALFFLVVDIVAGRPLFTPSLLGSVLVFGSEAKDVLSVRLDAVAYFSIASDSSAPAKTMTAICPAFCWSAMA